MTASRTTEEEGGKDEEVEEDEGEGGDEGGEKEAGCSRSAARSNRETAGNSLRPLRGSPSSRPPPRALSFFGHLTFPSILSGVGAKRPAARSLMAFLHLPSPLPSSSSSFGGKC